MVFFGNREIGQDTEAGCLVIAYVVIAHTGYCLSCQGLFVVASIVTAYIVAAYVVIAHMGMANELRCHPLWLDRLAYGRAYELPQYIRRCNILAGRTILVIVTQ